MKGVEGLINSNCKPSAVFFWYWLPVLLYAAFIFFLSSLSYGPSALDGPFLNKFLHLSEYAVLGVLLSRALRQAFPKLRLAQFYFWIIFICALYGLSDEFHQLFVAYRSFSFLDISADAAGGGLGAFIYFLTAG